MARYEDGLKRPTHIIEAALWQYSVWPICRCGHETGFDPHGLWYYFHRKGWDDRLTVACAKFWCRPCASRVGKRVRPVRLDLRKDMPSINLPLPDEREWKRIVSRFRG